MQDPSEATVERYEAFVATVGLRVRRGLIAAYGVEIGTEAAAEAMALAWERWSELAAMVNPAGYLYRVGQSRARPHIRWRRRTRTFPSVDNAAITDVTLVEVFDVLAKLRPQQRAAVLMVKSHGLSYREVAELLEISEDAVTNHVHRGLNQLRSMLEVER